MPDKGFLGGGPQFNKVGYHPSEDEIAPVVRKPGLQPHQLRAIIAAVVVLVLVAAVYSLSAKFDSTFIHHSGKGGISPSQKPGLEVDRTR
jgi:hypothetical protein